ncbi:MAG: bleomycin resistance protein [Beijerinckiaceae bacterium]
MAHLASVCPILATSDVSAAVAWYRDKLGSEVTLEADAHANVVRDGAELRFWRCEDGYIAENTSAFIRVRDIGEVHRQLSAASDGGKVSELQSREWGMREFCIWDPWGNLLRFGQKEQATPAKSIDDLSTKELLGAIAALSPEESNRQVAAVEQAIREERL